MMKKCIAVFAAAVTMVTAVVFAQAAESCDLIFTQKQGGKYIFCNNREGIRSTDLADISTENPKFLMNNEQLSPDKYAFFASFQNKTNLNHNGDVIAAKGFDIEVDVVFAAREDTEITIERLGFEVPQHYNVFLDGTEYSVEDEWGCFNAWASYLDMPIRRINSGNAGYPSGFEPITFTVKAGERVWLSEFIDNYTAIPYHQSVLIIADFKINSGLCDVNVAGFKSTGKMGDRSGFRETASFGSYYRDRQHKGISDGLNEVTAELEYTVDDGTPSGELPVTVYNQYKPEGNTVKKWYTHLNPRADEWSYDLCAESDMISLKYYDPLKLTYYGEAVPEEERTPYYIFDTKHTDISEYKKEYGNKSQYIPNRELKDGEGQDHVCYLGNYGVIYNYNIKVKNNGNKKRYLIYKLATSSNNIVYTKDCDGNVINGYALSKGTSYTRILDDMACLPIPAQSETSYTVCVILPPNYSGGMENSLYLSDYPSLIETYETKTSGIVKDRYFTGKNYYKWEKGSLYISEDRTEWTEAVLPSSVKNSIRGYETDYELYYTGNGYTLRPCLYDAGVYYYAFSAYRDMFLLDENFNLKAKQSFGSYPAGFTCANGVYYVKLAGSVFRSAEFKWWDVKQHELPCWNYGTLSALNDNGRIKLSDNGTDFYNVDYRNFKPEYIDSYGDYYYYADGRTLYLSKEGIYWRHIVFNERIRSFEVIGGNVIVNGKQSKPLPEFNDSVVLKCDGKYISTEVESLLIDNSPYIAMRPAAQVLGFDIEWRDGELCLSRDGSSVTIGKEDGVFIFEENSYAPLRVFAEELGFDVKYNAFSQVAVIE